MSDLGRNIVKSSDVVGVSVINPAKENLGKIEEIVLDKLSGQVRYVVLSFGGFLGMGDKYFPFPWKSFAYNDAENSFVLNVSKEKLKIENGFDKDHWPDMSRWSETVDTYYR
jgi:hypothetical protein